MGLFINKKIYLIIFLFFINISIKAAEIKPNLEKEYIMSEFLNEFDFKNSEQKKAFTDLLQESNIVPKNTSFEQIFPLRHNYDQFVLDMINLIKQMQEKFFARTGKQERWEVKEIDWIKNDSQRVLSNLKILGFKDSILPTTNKTDALCILGATNKTMLERMTYAEHLIQNGLQIDTIILIAGERYVTKDIDGTEEELKQIALKLNIDDWRKLTETDLIKELYKKSILSKANFKLIVVDTKACNGSRPTTQTTILELIKQLESNKNIQNMIFVSSQPNVKYQDAIIKTIFKSQDLNYKFETVGAGENADIQKMVEGLGSYIWAISPLILADMDEKIKDPKVKEALIELYSKNPLVYKILPFKIK